jgi:hypothetical protein
MSESQFNLLDQGKVGRALATRPPNLGMAIISAMRYRMERARQFGDLYGHAKA